MKKGLGIMVGVSLAALSVCADLIFSTDFETASQTTSNDPVDHGGTVASGYTVSAFTRGPGITAFRLDPSLATDLFISEAAGTNPGTNLTQAVSANAYFEFTVTAPAAIDFTELKFAVRGHGTASIGYATVRSSVDNYTADLGTASGAMNIIHTPISVDLSSISGFTDLEEVTFRFYVYDEYSGQQNRRIGVDNIQVSVIPEPATIGMLGVGAVAALLVRRFK